MPPAKKQKIDRKSNAAYITSQPLFDALRTATTSVADQTNLLKAARNSVQALHVKLVNDEDAAQHKMYMDNIATAYVVATKAYHEIFRQITLITAADISQGRPATKSHEKYVAVLDTIAKAQEAGEALRNSSEETGEESEKFSEEEVMKEEHFSDSSPGSPPTVLSSKSTSTTLPTGLRKRPFVEDDATAEGANDAHDNNAPRISTDLQRKMSNKSNRKVRRAMERAAADSSAGGQGKPDPVDLDQVSAPPTTKIEEHGASTAPVVEFEDVHSEVEARVKAKAEKTAAKKARRADEKKRKRESVGSLINDGADDEMTRTEPEPESAVAKDDLVEKPKKKKSKKIHVKDVADGAAAKVDAASLQNETDKPASTAKPVAKATKRKPEVESAAVEGGGGGKKRKMKHADKN